MYDAKQLKTLFGSLLIILIPNIIMMLLCYLTDTQRIIINVDYFIPLLLLACRQRIFFIITFIIISLFDFLALFIQLFPFIRIGDLFYLSKFAFISSASYQLYIVVLVILIIVQSYFFLRIYNVKYNKPLLMLFNIIIFYYAYSVHFMNNTKLSFSNVNTNIVGSQTINNMDYINSGFIQTYTMTGDAFQKPKVKGATAELFDHSEGHNKVLLVVNEAWGVPTNSAIQNDVLLPLLNNPTAYNFNQGSLSFVGATLGGELRELCAKAPIHYNLKNQFEGFEDCLPNKYKRLGYETVAVHGAIGFMYDRQYWYPRAGFEQMLFRDKGLNLPNSRCYSFPGNCDKDIAPRIVEQFNTHNKLFLYWLTLNTHAIYDERDLKSDLFDCHKYKIKNDTATCRNLKLQKQFFYTLSGMIKNPSFSGTRVIVVGDHEPPLIEEGSNIFVTGKVPIFKFEIK